MPPPYRRLAPKDKSQNIKRLGFFELLEFATNRKGDPKGKEASALLHKNSALGLSPFFLSFTLLPLALSKGRKESMGNMAFGVFVAVGVVCGTIFAVSLKTSSLVLFFSIMTMIFAIYFLIEKEKINLKPKKINLIYRVILGFSSGFLSAPMGIGGGVYNTPIFKMFGYPINVAIGSSAAIGFLISIVGAITFASSGSYFNINAPLSLGFLNIPAFLIFIPITMFMARIGANSAHKIEKTKLQVFFGIFLYVVGTIFVYRYSGL